MLRLAIIDPSVGPYEKKYPISRKIAPGDVERFHIMVGSSMSCHLQVRFKFFIDRISVIESEIFNMSIWNPRNAQWQYKYIDDKDALKSRYSLYGRELTQPDSLIFPLTLSKREFANAADNTPVTPVWYGTFAGKTSTTGAFPDFTGKANKSHDTSQDLSSHTIVSGDDTIQKKRESWFRKLLHIFRNC